MEILHSQSYNKLVEEVDLCSVVENPITEKAAKRLGIAHEHAVDDLEAGRLRFDEFQAFRRELRRLGLTDLFY